MNVIRIARFAGTAMLLVPSSLWARPSSVTVVLRNFSFAPSQIHLRAGQPVTLHLSNPSSNGHSFAAPAFFAAALVTPASRAAIANGVIEVPKHSGADVTITPAAGRYPLKCDHAFHRTLGMRGLILVD